MQYSILWSGVVVRFVTSDCLYRPTCYKAAAVGDKLCYSAAAFIVGDSITQLLPCRCSPCLERSTCAFTSCLPQSPQDSYYQALLLSMIQLSLLQCLRSDIFIVDTIIVSAT